MDKDIGSILRKKRMESGLSVKDISTHLTNRGYKASEKTIYSWENGRSQPTPEALLEMCDAYGIKDILTTFGYNGYKEDGSIQLNMYEIDFVEKYRLISKNDINGKDLVDSTVDYLCDKINKNQEKDQSLANLQTQLKAKDTRISELEATLNSVKPTPEHAPKENINQKSELQEYRTKDGKVITDEDTELLVARNGKPMSVEDKKRLIQLLDGIE